MKSFYLFIIVILCWSCNTESILHDTKSSRILISSKTPLKESDSDYLSNLRAYKKSKHQLMGAYYRVWSDKATGFKRTFTTMTQLPDSLDIVIVFSAYAKDNNPFWRTLKEKYVPYLHARGTKVVFSRSASHMYKNLKTHSEQEYKERANQLISDYVDKYNVDGLDFDIEGYYNPTQVADMAGVLRALSTKLGPLSGTDKILIYDTNKRGSRFNYLFPMVKDYISYVFLQIYGAGTYAIDRAFNYYSSYIRPDQFFPGFSFYEENSQTDWNDVTYPLDGTGRCYDYARWQPSKGIKGGIFAYAIDRDIPRKTDENISPNYSVTKQLIATMNPPLLNLVKNHGFEDDNGKYWQSEYGARWDIGSTEYVQDYPGMVNVDDKQAVEWAKLHNSDGKIREKIHGGKNTLVLGLDDQNNINVFQVISNLKPNTTYKLSAWFYGDKPGVKFGVGVKDYGGTEKSVESNVVGEYVHLTLDFKTGASNTSAKIYASKIQGEGYVFVDDFLLQKVISK